MPDSHKSVRIVQRGLVLATVIVGLIGCATQFLGEAPKKWDSWIGTSKDDRVRELGIPVRCHAFKTGGEVCEWQQRWTQDIAGTINIQFDAKSIACHWIYRDFYGERQSQAVCS